jgi:hypothetical protein
MATDEPRPLIAAIEERDLEERTRRRLTAERCEAVELCLRRVGFAPGTSYWSVALLVARVAGWQPLRRAIDDLAADPAIATASKSPESRKRIVRRALDELQRWGLLEWTTETGETRRRTRAVSVAVVQLDRAAILNEATENTTQRDTDNPPDNAKDNANDNRADNGQDNVRTTARTIENVSSYTLKPNFPFPPSPPLQAETATTEGKAITKAEPGSTFDQWTEAAEAIRSAGVDHWRAVLAACREFGVSPGELIDAAFVVRHTARLSPGALLSWVRSGGWPCGGVETAEAIRRRRSERAEGIRRKTTAEAPANCTATRLAAVVGRRLNAEGLADLATAEELAAFEAAERTRRNGTAAECTAAAEPANL